MNEFAMRDEIDRLREEADYERYHQPVSETTGPSRTNSLTDSEWYTLETRLQHIQAHPIQAKFARRIARLAGLDYALATIQGWNAEAPHPDAA